MAYGTLEAFQAYWAARNLTGPLGTEACQREALEHATTFVDGLGWRATKTGWPISRFPGVPTVPGQVNAWPRTGAVDSNGVAFADDVVPDLVERATYEAAIYEIANPGGLNIALRHDQVVKREKFAEVEFEYMEGGTPKHGLSPSTPIIPAVMTILAPVLNGGANAYGITGVVA